MSSGECKTRAKEKAGSVLMRKRGESKGTRERERQGGEKIMRRRKGARRIKERERERGRERLKW